MGRSYEDSRDALLVAVKPLVNAGEGRFHHGKVTAEGIPRRVGGVTEGGEVQENARDLEASFMVPSPSSQSSPRLPHHRD